MRSNQVVRETGFSLRQLQWLDEKGIVSPSIDRTRRNYSPEDLRRLQIIKAVREKGFSLAFATRVMRAVEECPVPYVVTDGRMFGLCNSLHFAATRVMEFRRLSTIISVPYGEPLPTESAI